MNYRLAFFAVALLLANAAFGQSYKQPPQDGVWYNPLESGRGWSIETQAEIVAIAHYGYTPAGDSAFFLSTGIWDAQNGVLQTDLFSFGDGQCFGCAYRAPVASSLGAVRFEFANTTTGTAIYPNGTRVPMQRFDFGYAAPEDKLLGEWATSWYSATGNSFSNFVYFKRRCTSCTTPNSVEGTLELSRSGRRALASYVAGVYLVLIDAAPGFYDYYYMNSEPDRMRGLGCTTSSSAAPPSVTSCLGLAYGSRASSLQNAQGLHGSTKRDSAAIDLEVRQRVLASELQAQTSQELSFSAELKTLTDDPRIAQEVSQTWDQLKADMELAR